MPASRAPRSPRLDPLHSPGSAVPAQPQQLQRQPRSPAQLAAPAPTLVHLTLSSEDAGPTFRQNRATTEPMVKTKRRMFSSPLLRRSATASSAAAASAASKIKSNLSTVTKLPTALKRSATTNTAGNGAAPSNDDDKANVDRAPTIASMPSSSSSSSSTESDVKQHSNKMFSIPAMMRIRTGSKEDKPQETKESTQDKSEQSNNGSTSGSSEAEGDNDVASTSPPQMSAINSASRFVMGMPTLLRRAVSNNAPASTATHKKSPDTSANSTPRGQFPEDDFEENERHSLLMMMQVPESRRNSQIPLMAVTEAW